MEKQFIVISPEVLFPSEIRKIREMFQSGLEQFHIRKPGFSDLDMINYITSIPREFRKYLVLHSHFYLAKEFKLKGIQVSKNSVQEAHEFKNDFTYYGYSAHSFKEVLENKNEFSHFFLSPVYNSLSKKGYLSGFKSEELRKFNTENADIKISALGGLDFNNSKLTMELGFWGIAVLGAIWQKKDTLQAYRKISTSLKSRPIVLTIAGFDPCCGTGVTADIKTFEEHSTIGLAVNTAISYQNDSDFYAVDWLNFNQIKRQIDVLFLKYKPDYVKIGLIENFSILRLIITLLKTHYSEIKIIWDPILKASANFQFHKFIKREELKALLEQVYLLIPNITESLEIFGTSEPTKIQDIIKEFPKCNILLKGGHLTDHKGTDVLIDSKQISSFEGRKLKCDTKHGTGCVLSSAICANLSGGMNLMQSVSKAKLYIEKFIDSNSSMLGYHNTKQIV